jgi:N-carbamoylputrescine amidase
MRELFDQNVPRPTSMPRAARGSSSILPAPTTLKTHEASSVVRLGCSRRSALPDPAANLKKNLEWPSAPPNRAPNHLHAGTFSVPVFLPGEEHENFKLRSRFPALHGRVSKDREEARCRHHRFTLRKARFGLYHNTAAVIDADGKLLGIYRKMHIPDDPLYYEKVYFTPGDLGFQGVANEVRQNRRSCLLGSMVSEGARLTAMQARRSCFIPLPSAGIQKKRPSTVRNSTVHGN